MLADGHFSRVYDLQTSARSSRYFSPFPGEAPARVVRHRLRLLAARTATRGRNVLHDTVRQQGQLRQAGIFEFPPADLSWCRATSVASTCPLTSRCWFRAAHRTDLAQALAGGAFRRLAQRLAERGIASVVDRRGRGEGIWRRTSQPRST